MDPDIAPYAANYITRREAPAESSPGRSKAGEYR
jgi:hypothetical protein